MSKQIHSRKLLLDDHTDRLQKNLHMIKRKEEATLAAREEIKTQSLREMQLQSEVNCNLTFRLPYIPYLQALNIRHIVTIIFPA